MTVRSLVVATSCWLGVVLGPVALAAGPSTELHQSVCGSLWRMAHVVRQADDVTQAQAMLGLLKANPQAFTSSNINALKRGATLRVPGTSVFQAVSPSAATTEVMRQNDVWKAARAGAHPPVMQAIKASPDGRDLLGQRAPMLDASGPAEVAAITSGKVQLLALAERAAPAETTVPATQAKQPQRASHPQPQQVLPQPAASMSTTEAAEVVAKELHGAHHPTTLRLGDRAMLEAAIRRSEERQLAALKALQVEWAAHIKRLHEVQVETTDELADFRDAWEAWVRRQPSVAVGAHAVAMGPVDSATTSQGGSDAMLWVIGLLVAVLLVGVIRLLLAALAERRRRCEAASSLPQEKEADDDAASSSQRGPRPLTSSQADDEGDYDLLGSEDGVGATLEAARAYVRMGDLEAAQTTLASLDPERLTAAQRQTLHEVAQAVTDASSADDQPEVTSPPKTVAPSATPAADVSPSKSTEVVEPAKAGDEPAGDEEGGAEDHGGDSAQSVERPAS